MELRRGFGIRKFWIGMYLLFLSVYFTVFLSLGLNAVDATPLDISAELAIPSIGLESDVTTLQLENYSLKTPDLIVGSYIRAKNKTLLIGHSSTVFKDLDKVWDGAEIIYDDTVYHVLYSTVMKKEDINMNALLAGAERETLILMTCAGEDLGGGDATHRLIIKSEV